MSTRNVPRGDIANTTGGDRFTAISASDRPDGNRARSTRTNYGSGRRHANAIAYTSSFDLTAEVEGVLTPVSADLGQPSPHPPATQTSSS